MKSALTSCQLLVAVAGAIGYNQVFGAIDLYHVHKKGILLWLCSGLKKTKQI